MVTVFFDKRDFLALLGKGFDGEEKVWPLMQGRMNISDGRKRQEESVVSEC